MVWPSVQTTQQSYIAILWLPIKEDKKLLLFLRSTQQRYIFTLIIYTFIFVYLFVAGFVIIYHHHLFPYLQFMCTKY